MTHNITMKETSSLSKIKMKDCSWLTSNGDSLLVIHLLHGIFLLALYRKTSEEPDIRDHIIYLHKLLVKIQRTRLVSIATDQHLLNMGDLSNNDVCANSMSTTKPRLACVGNVACSMCGLRSM